MTQTQRYGKHTKCVVPKLVSNTKPLSVEGTEEQRDKQTDRQTHRHIDRQSDKQTET